MSLTGSILGTFTHSASENHLETFDFSDADNPTLVDTVSFAAGEALFGTVFVDGKAIASTELIGTVFADSKAIASTELIMQGDPQFAFAIGADGSISLESEFSFSGRNTAFQPVFDGSRLIGVGSDYGGEFANAAVRLYEIDDLTQSNPLIARATPDMQLSNSPVFSDRRACFIEENASAAIGADGTPETGLVLLPLYGTISSGDEVSILGTQIFTFSENTLTARGMMRQFNVPDRTFIDENASTAVNFTDRYIHTFDISDPDAPSELGFASLVKNYSAFYLFEGFGVRIEGSSYLPAPEGMTDEEWAMQECEAQVIPLSSDVNAVEPTASVRIPCAVGYRKVGNLILGVVVGAASGADGPSLLVIDVEDPSSPRVASIAGSEAVADSLTFLKPESLGLDRAVVYVRNSNIDDLDIQEAVDVGVACGMSTPSSSCREGTNWVEGCDFVEGYAVCMAQGGDPEFCTSDGAECTVRDGLAQDCTKIDILEDRSAMTCSDYSFQRHSTRVSLEVLDLTDPSRPLELGPTELRITDGGGDVTAVADGSAHSSIWISYQEKEDVPGDSRPYVRFYAQRIDLSVPAAPVMEEPLNVPGRVIEANGDTLITEDAVYGNKGIDFALHRVSIQNGSVTSVDQIRFENSDGSATLNRSGRAAVVSASNLRSGMGENPRLTVLDTENFTAPLFSTELSAEYEILDFFHDGLLMRSDARDFPASAWTIYFLNLKDTASPVLDGPYPMPVYNSESLTVSEDDKRACLATPGTGIFCMQTP